jgi:TldD protein
MPEPSHIFAERFGVTPNDLESLLSEALSAGGDYADLYLEHRVKDLLSLEEGIVKSASKNISQGLGVPHFKVIDSKALHQSAVH